MEIRQVAPDISKNSGATMSGFGMNDRNVYRRIDIINALAACVYAAKANGGTVDRAIVGSLCLAFGIDVAEVRQRVLEMEAAL